MSSTSKAGAAALHFLKERGLNVPQPASLFRQCWRDGRRDPTHALPADASAPFPIPAYSNAMLIAHGLMGTSNNFFTPGLQLTKMLGPSIDGICALDMRNHGRSQHDAQHCCISLALDLAHYVKRMADAAPVAGLPPRYAVMGHSMGGTAVMVAACLAADPATPAMLQERWEVENPARAKDDGPQAALDAFREYVGAVVVVDVGPSPRMPGAFNRIDSDLGALEDVPLDTTMNSTVAGRLLKSKIPNDMMRNFLLTNLRSGDERRAIPAAWRCNLPVLRQSLGHLVFPFDDASVMGVPVRTPTLFLFGDRSPYNHPAARKSIDAFFPDAQAVDIEDSDHYPHVEQKEAFCTAVAKFVGDSL